ncbi:MAG: hypothetical protein K0U12_04020, partial [Gammaproteobacteria bacterium]|nr:hypothetical protein [Gammaproteobacteria bacterium]
MNQYPLWRYILLVILIVIGLVYAAPNLFGEDPAIQVTPKNAAALPIDLSQRIATGL